MNAVIPCSKGVNCNWPACPRTCPERPGAPLNNQDKTWQLLKRSCLRELTWRTVELPSSWSTRKVYDDLVAEGLATGGYVNNFIHRYKITDKGIKQAKADTSPIFK